MRLVRVMWMNPQTMITKELTYGTMLGIMNSIELHGNLKLTDAYESEPVFVFDHAP
jgi:hypothetical protein